MTLQNIPVIDAVKKALVCGTKECTIIYAQLLWYLGGEVDGLLTALSGDKPPALETLRVTSTTDPIATKHQVDKDNALYLLGVKEQWRSSTKQFLSMTTDKSRVRSMGVQNSAFAQPDGKAWWGLSQEWNGHKEKSMKSLERR